MPVGIHGHLVERGLKYGPFLHFAQLSSKGQPSIANGRKGQKCRYGRTENFTKRISWIKKIGEKVSVIQILIEAVIVVDCDQSPTRFEKSRVETSSV